MLRDCTSITERRLPEPDDWEAARHERHARSIARVMLPMMDVANLVERTPEADRWRAAEHERFAGAMEGLPGNYGRMSQRVFIRLAAWLERHLVSVPRQREAPGAADRQ